MSMKHPYKEGTIVIVDWGDIGPRRCTINEYVKSKKSLGGTMVDYYTVKTEKGQILLAGKKETNVDTQYYRELRLNKLLNKNI